MKLAPGLAALGILIGCGPPPGMEATLAEYLERHPVVELTTTRPTYLPAGTPLPANEYATLRLSLSTDCLTLRSAEADLDGQPLTPVSLGGWQGLVCAAPSWRWPGPLPDLPLSTLTLSDGETVVRMSAPRMGLVRRPALLAPTDGVLDRGGSLTLGWPVQAEPSVHLYAAVVERGDQPDLPIGSGHLDASGLWSVSVPGEILPGDATLLISGVGPNWVDCEGPAYCYFQPTTGSVRTPIRIQ